MNNKKAKISFLLLLLVAAIWGSALAVNRRGMDYVGPLTFQALRSLLGGVVLIPAAILSEKKTSAEDRENNGFKKAIPGGIVCGVLLVFTAATQQIGMLYTTVGKSGFLGSMHIVIIPLISVFLGRKVKWNIWLGVALALIGMYFMCISDSFYLSKGDALIILCALLTSGRIMSVDHFVKTSNPVWLSCISFFVAGLLFFVSMFIFETPRIDDILNGWLPIVYSAVMSCGVAYTLQMVGQKNLQPSLAAMVLGLESVFAAVFGWLIMGQTMTLREILGGVIMFAAIISVTLLNIYEKGSKGQAGGPERNKE